MAFSKPLLLVLFLRLLLNPIALCLAKPHRGLGHFISPTGPHNYHATPPPPALRNSPPVPPATPWRHHVFLNFRGLEVRHAFSDHLYHALVRNGIMAFRDDHDLPRGENVKEAIPTAIEDSVFSIVVLSRGYASSEWCLDELVKIMVTRKEKGHRPFPVFYQLSTDDVANHLSSGWYKDAFDLHKKMYSYERVQSWSQALTSIADISGWVLSGDRSEVEMVEEISQKMLWNVHQLGRESSVVASGRMSLRFKTGTSAIDPEDEVGDASPPCNSNSAKEEENTIVEHQAHSTASAIPQEDAAGEEDGDHNRRLWMSRTCTTTSNKNDRTHHHRQDRVLESSPWCIANATFVMRKWQPNMQLANLVQERRSTTFPVWVTLVGVPVEYMNAKGLSYIASVLGEPLYMDRATASRSQLASAKVCVEMRLSGQEWETTIDVALGGGNGVVVVVRVFYQWRPCQATSY